jgi:hypothetical protein
MTGKRHTPETKAKIRAAAKGRTQSDATKAKLSTIFKGRTIAPETVAKIVAARAGYRHSPETIEKLRAAQLARIAAGLVVQKNKVEVPPHLEKFVRKLRRCGIKGEALRHAVEVSP